ncbi:MAG: DNA translocase FtsK 4TM domain-containing protein, partial [Eudoraea sp.]|nr:DNA translocase FtsK 4TM domain-containing protein [Eudoraea sp.]NNK30492.1 DNA translocase FtsK [Flavobacteriaceae bacterium]
MAKKKKRSRAASAKKGFSFTLSTQNKIILGSLLILFSIALFFSFASFYFTWQADQSLLTEFADRNEQAENLLNKFGASVSHFFMYKGFGLASFILPFLLCLTGLYLFLGLEKKGLLSKWIWGLVFLIWTSIALGFFAFEQPLLGGLVGYEMNDFLQDYTGKIGVFLLLLFVLTVILVRLFRFSPQGMADFLRNKVKSVKTEFKQSKQGDTIILEPEKEEVQPIPDPYTHKEDIPVIKQEINTTNGELPATEPPADTDIQMEVEAVQEEKEETDILADKLVEDFGEFDPTLELGNYKF